MTNPAIVGSAKEIGSPKTNLKSEAFYLKKKSKLFLCKIIY